MIVPDSVLAEIRRAKRILAICHVSPDGDAVGSLLGLGLALRALGKQVSLACQDPIPPQLAFLPGAASIVHQSDGNEELIVTLDSSDTERLGSLYVAEIFGQKPVINIDHHITNINFGDINWVDDVAATAQLCFGLVSALGAPMDASIATCLLTGIVTDTRSFRTPNTTPLELRTAVELMEAGANLADIADKVYRNYSPARLCLWGKALSSARLEGGILWTEISRKMLDRCQATELELNGLASFLDATRGALASVVFQEKGERVEASLRSARGVDISGVALGLGGGGHPQAAGCTCTGSLADVRERVLDAVSSALRTQGHIEQISQESERPR